MIARSIHSTWFLVPFYVKQSALLQMQLLYQLVPCGMHQSTATFEVHGGELCSMELTAVLPGHSP